MWQAGISLAASPLANSSRALPAMEYGGSAAAHPLSHPASYAGYHIPKKKFFSNLLSFSLLTDAYQSQLPAIFFLCTRLEGDET